MKAHICKINILQIISCLIIISSYFFSIKLHSQSLLWHHRIGSENFENVSAITIDASENVIIAGNFDQALDFDPSASGVFSLIPNGLSDVYLCKFNTHGQFLWAKSIGDQFNDLARSVCTDANGNIYVTGIFDGTVDFDPGPSTYTLSSAGPGNGFILKLGPQGNFLWARAFASPAQNEGTRLKTDASGNVWITGYFSGTTDFNSGGTSVQNLTAKGATDAFLICYDAYGTFLFVRNFGSTSSNAYGKSICTSPNGNACLLIEFNNQCDADPSAAVITHTSLGYSDLLIVTLTSSGNYISSFSFGGTYQEFGFDIKSNSNGEIFVGGSFYSYQIDFDPGPASANFTNKGGLDGFVAKYNPNGQYIQAWQFGGAGDDETNGIEIDNSGNLIIHGWFENSMDVNPGTGVQNVISIGAHDAFVVALNTSGNYIKSFTYGGAYFCNNSFCGTSDDMIYMTSNGNGMLYCTSASSGTNVTFFPNTPQQVVTTATGAYDVFNFKINFNSVTSFLEEPAEINSIKIYPQPCGEILNISNIKECSSVELFDMSGKKILNIIPSVRENIKLNVDNLNTGVYFIRVCFKDKKKVVRFIKE